ncbi:hypothetical protein B9Z19DRAFT_1104352 [Tuber borchii]|uniref:Uncharacterized protein n=1 Tax=Tuber borchii TaxID=42251 RepID=A0A2T6ZAR9_TUBBO|nr:hypothetical protein B9Z19DRAFT_1104352 [Tuber borchii]
MSATDDRDAVFETARLTAKYPFAYTDFYGISTPCVYKSGPKWPVIKETQNRGIEREARPVYNHAITLSWLSIGNRIYCHLDSIGVKCTSINPLAYADIGDDHPFCSLIIVIGVKPYSLDYDTAVTAAAMVKEILGQAGFPNIEAAFVERVVTRAVRAEPKLLSFDPLLDYVSELQKPFTSALGLSIAPQKYPHFEGTGGLYFHLDRNSRRTAVLTCTHVACSPLKKNNQAHQEFIALGTGGYDKAVEILIGTIGGLTDTITEFQELARGENPRFIANSEKRIQEVNKLNSECAIGYLLHSEKMKLGAKPCGFTEDWALIELYEERIDWNTFKGNKVYNGGKFSIVDFGAIMFPQPGHWAKYSYPENSLLQAYEVVGEAELWNLQNGNFFDKKYLLVIKNRSTTGTTVGRTNGMESFTHIDDDLGTEITTIEIAVLLYTKNHGRISDHGDFGSIVLGRDGHIVRLLIGIFGLTPETDITYLAPYW